MPHRTDDLRIREIKELSPPGHILRAPGEERCRGCHTPEHSTAFEWEGYRARILGPGHGAPAAR